MLTSDVRDLGREITLTKDRRKILPNDREFNSKEGWIWRERENRRAMAEVGSGFFKR